MLFRHQFAHSVPRSPSFNTGDMIEPYTTGYNTEINVAAKKWLKQMRAQCDYGNGAPLRTHADLYLQKR